MNPLVMFDFDGVVADSFDVYFAEFTYVCTEMGLKRLNSREAFLKLMEGNPLKQLFWSGFPIWRLKRVAQKFQPRIEEASRTFQPFEGMPEVVTEIAGRHPVYVITHNATQFVNDFMEKYGIRGVKDVLGSDAEQSKIKKIRSIIRHHPERTPYYIGDTKGDMREAHKAGAIPIAVAWGYHSVEKLLEGNPQHVVESPAALVRLFGA